MSAFQNKFELRRPSPQNAVDIFAGAWATDFSVVKPGISAGDTDLFVGDTRPQLAAQALGHDHQTFSKMRVLELGPLEGAHTYQIEKLGAAEVVSIEANVEAYLKCLIVKETLNLQRVKFLCGDFVEYLRDCSERFDLVFCCGVLYHMSNPLELIELISKVTDRAYVWTVYFKPERCPGRTENRVTWAGFEASYHELEYPNMDYERFWGGNKPVAAWLEKQTILDACKHFGFTELTPIDENPDHIYAPVFSFAARR